MDLGLNLYSITASRHSALPAREKIHRGWLKRLLTSSGKYFNGTDPHEITAS
jgi:hypothetical protein